MDDQKVRQSIESRVEEWHNSNCPLSLCEYLGWTPKDYLEWIEDHKIPQREIDRLWNESRARID